MISPKVTLSQTKYLLISQRRNFRGALFTVLFPIVLFLFFAEVFGGDQAITHGEITQSPESYFLGGVTAYAIMSAAFTSLSIRLVTQRETGLLNRFLALPATAWSFLVAQILTTFVLVIVEVIVLFIFAEAIYGIDVNLAQVALLITLGTFAMSALGFAITGLIADIDSAASIPPFVAILLSFISGVFLSVDRLPSGLEHIGRIFPLAHLADGMQIASGTAGTIQLTTILHLVGWGVGGLILSTRTFRWNPRHRK